VIPAKEKGKFALRVKDSFEIVKLGAFDNPNIVVRFDKIVIIR
jgi:hypothetical protein